MMTTTKHKENKQNDDELHYMPLQVARLITPLNMKKVII